MGWTKAKETVDYGEVELSMQRRGDFGGRMSVKGAGSESKSNTNSTNTDQSTFDLERGRASASLLATLFLSSFPPSLSSSPSIRSSHVAYRRARIARLQPVLRQRRHYTCDRWGGLCCSSRRHQTVRRLQHSDSLCSQSV